MRVGGSTRVRTVSFPECIGLDAVLAVGHRPTRNFGEPQKLSRGGSDRLVEVYQPFIGAALASDELVITRGVADYGNDFADRAVTAVRRFSNFTEAGGVGPCKSQIIKNEATVGLWPFMIGEHGAMFACGER
jgi:hypothetical protein